MVRPRNFDHHAVVERVKQVFWDQGYQDTAIDDLEGATGLSRSSLYATFGTKQELFTEALDAYVGSFIDGLLRPMERADASIDDVERFFHGLAERFRGDEQAMRGCLMVNSIAELEGRSDILGGRADAFRKRLRVAFANALGSDHGPSDGENRAHLLTTTTLGIWLTVRTSRRAAAEACEAVIAQIRAW